MLAFRFIVFLVYIGLVTYIISTSGLSFDLYERRFRLFPSWFRIIALVWFVVSLIVIIVFKDSIGNLEELLLSNINISLFIQFFSKQKFEDEFSEQIRFRAFTYSFVSIVAMGGALSTLFISSTVSNGSNFMLHGLFGAGLFIASLYFYITVYKLKKENI